MMEILDVLEEALAAPHAVAHPFLCGEAYTMADGAPPRPPLPASSSLILPARAPPSLRASAPSVPP